MYDKNGHYVNLWISNAHWRRQLWGTGARAPSTFNCLLSFLGDNYVSLESNVRLDFSSKMTRKIKQLHVEGHGHIWKIKFAAENCGLLAATPEHAIYTDSSKIFQGPDPNLPRYRPNILDTEINYIWYRPYVWRPEQEARIRNFCASDKGTLACPSLKIYYNAYKISYTYDVIVFFFLQCRIWSYVVWW